MSYRDNVEAENQITGHDFKCGYGADADCSCGLFGVDEDHNPLPYGPKQELVFYDHPIYIPIPF